MTSTDLDHASQRGDVWWLAAGPGRSNGFSQPVDVSPVMTSVGLPRYGRLRARLDRLLSRFND